MIEKQNRGLWLVDIFLPPYPSYRRTRNNTKKSGAINSLWSKRTHKNT